MANRHFGKLADVWKHLVLAEVLSTDVPTRVFDTHAGHAIYPMSEDAERAYGVVGFLDVTRGDATLRDSAYSRLLLRHQGGRDALIDYPAGPMLAMLERGAAASYLFCDLDPLSIASIRSTALQLKLDEQVETVEADGVTAVHEALAHASAERVLLYTDPFDHHAKGPSGLSPLDLAAEVAGHGPIVVYWYGYNRADQRGWILDLLRDLTRATEWWCGDLMVSAPGASLLDGDLGAATSPGTGFGMVTANASAFAVAQCTQLGIALAQAYEGRPLPNGRVGALDFQTLSP